MQNQVVYEYRITGLDNAKQPHRDLVDVLRLLGNGECLDRTWVVYPYDLTPLAPGKGLARPGPEALANALFEAHDLGAEGWVAYTGLDLLHRAAETWQVIMAVLIRLRAGAPLGQPIESADTNPDVAGFQHPDADLELRFDEESAMLAVLTTDPGAAAVIGVIAGDASELPPADS
jgi:hypothetical protein